MTNKGLMIQCLKNKHINIDEMIEQNYILFDRITKAMNEYHKAKLKLLGTSGVVKPLKCGECDCNEKYPNLDINILDFNKEI
jgi:hypothetical protein